MKFGSFQVLHIIVDHLFKMTEKQQEIFNTFYFYNCIILGQYKIIFPCNAKSSKAFRNIKEIVKERSKKSHSV